MFGLIVNFSGKIIMKLSFIFKKIFIYNNNNIINNI